MSATDPEGERATDREDRYIDTMPGIRGAAERECRALRAERDEAIAERDAAHKQIERVLFILCARSLTGQQARARALTILTEGDNDGR